MKKESWEKELEKHEQFDRLEVNTWNAAIEAAAKRAEETAYDPKSDKLDTFTINEIRKLKR